MNLSNKFFKPQSIYQAILPYNINWIIQDLKPIAHFLNSNPLIVADVGARGGSLEELENLRNFISYYAFDADREECERLQRNPPAGFHSFNVFPYFVSNQAGIADFNLYKALSASSIFTPDKRFKANFTDQGLEIEKTVKVESDTLDNLLKQKNLPAADIIKLDTQGSELSILQSSPESLSKAFLLEVEVEFTPIYTNQPLFYDVHKFLHESGYELLYLNRVFRNRSVYDGLSRGQLIFADALFGKREDKLEGFTAEKIAKYAIALINYGHKDIAFQICQLYPEVSRLIPNIGSYFELNTYNRISNLKKKSYFFLDKVIAFLLHKRKTNRIHIDSDRSYPIR